MAQNIKLKIAGIEYPMAVNSPEMEETMRIAAEEISTSAFHASKYTKP